jgi:hypothetical protein
MCLIPPPPVLSLALQYSHCSDATLSPEPTPGGQPPWPCEGQSNREGGRDGMNGDVHLSLDFIASVRVYVMSRKVLGLTVWRKEGGRCDGRCPS